MCTAVPTAVRLSLLLAAGRIAPWPFHLGGVPWARVALSAHAEGVDLAWILTSFEPLVLALWTWLAPLQVVREALPFWHCLSLPCPEARGPRSLAGPQVFRNKVGLHVYSLVGPWSLVLLVLVVVLVVCGAWL